MEQPARSPGYRWVVLGVATFAQAASCFFVQGIGALSLVLRADLGLSATQLGLLLSASQVVPLVGLLVAGRLLDRYDERWVVGIGGCVIAAGLGVGFVAPGYVWLLIALLIVGAGYSTVQPGGSKSVAGWFDPSQRGLAMGIRQAGLPLGGVLSAAALPALARSSGLRTALAVGALTALLGAVAFMGLYRRPRDRPTARLVRAVAPEAGVRRVRPFAAVRRLAHDPAMAELMLSGMCMVSVHSAVAMLAVSYLHTTSSISAGVAALVYAGVQATGAAGRIGLAAWSDRRPGRRHSTVTASMAAVIGGMVLLTTPAGRIPAVAVAVFLWLGFFGIGWYGPWVAHLAESAPPDRTGFALGSVMAVNQIAVVAAPPMLGLLNDATHSFAPVWAALSAMVAIALTVMKKRRTYLSTGPEKIVEAA